MEFNKKKIVCPKCGHTAHLAGNQYFCTECNWTSATSTINISFYNEVTAPYSPLFPHKFTFTDSSAKSVTCMSMETLLQSLKVKDPTTQKFICENYSGFMASSMFQYEMNEQLWWNGKEIDRDSEEYKEFVTLAYDCLYETNPVFAKILLPKTDKMFIISSATTDFSPVTTLTENELRYQLNRLRTKHVFFNLNLI